MLSSFFAFGSIMYGWLQSQITLESEKTSTEGKKVIDAIEIIVTMTKSIFVLVYAPSHHLLIDHVHLCFRQQQTRLVAALDGIWFKNYHHQTVGMSYNAFFCANDDEVDFCTG